MTQTFDDIYRVAIRHYGAAAQLNVAQEECAELIQAISKIIRYGTAGKYRENLIEEMADVHICIEQLMIICSISPDEVAEIEGQKILRLNERMNNYVER